MSDQIDNSVDVSEDELFLKYTFAVDGGQEPERIDKYLVKFFQLLVFFYNTLLFL